MYLLSTSHLFGRELQSLSIEKTDGTRDWKNGGYDALVNSMRWRCDSPVRPCGWFRAVNSTGELLTALMSYVQTHKSVPCLLLSQPDQVILVHDQAWVWANGIIEVVIVRKRVCQWRTLATTDITEVYNFIDPVHDPVWETRCFDGAMPEPDSESDPCEELDSDDDWDDELCPYAVLGLSEDATMAEVRKAFLSRSRATHPDKTGDSNSRHEFDLVKKAYDAISQGAL